MKNKLFFLMTLNSAIIFSQVGIGTTTPTESLQVVGGNIELGDGSGNPGSIDNPMFRIHSKANDPNLGGSIEFNENDLSYGVRIRHNTATDASGREGLYFENKFGSSYRLSLFLDLNSNIGIKTAIPESTLDIRATNHLGAVTSQDGILIPRVSSLSNLGGAEGRMVYLTTSSATKVKGFYFWDGSKWSSFTSNSSSFSVSYNSIENVAEAYTTESPQIPIPINQINTSSGLNYFSASGTSLTFLRSGIYVLQFNVNFAKVSRNGGNILGRIRFYLNDSEINSGTISLPIDVNASSNFVTTAIVTVNPNDVLVIKGSKLGTTAYAYSTSFTNGFLNLSLQN